MLKLAVAAQLPMVAVVTRDRMNLHMVLKELTGKDPVEYNPAQTTLGKRKLYTWVWNPKAPMPLFALYESLVAAESTLVLVNMPKPEEPVFDAGEVPVPRTLMLTFMQNVVDDAVKAEELLRGLGGCTIREAAEMARLTMARDKSLTLQGIMKTRKSSFQGQSGLTQVDTSQTFYNPPPELQEWLTAEKAFFLHGADPRLIPRGLLMDGPPGTGKTAAAKWLSENLGVPLYRVDIGGTKGKYVGQSENQMLANLGRLDHEEPCVALIDEIEKVFSTGNNDSSGTTSTMLSQLLWWLAERRSRILVVMTTNNAKSLPKELYREGRIDQVMWFGGLEPAAARKFVVEVLKTFSTKVFPETGDEVAGIVNSAIAASNLGTNPPTVSQAALTKAAYAFVKETSKPSLPSAA